VAIQRKYLIRLFESSRGESLTGSQLFLGNSSLRLTAAQSISPQPLGNY